MELFIIALLFIVAAQTTYLTVRTAKKRARIAQAPVFVDTSVLIDGRIISIAESGFIGRTLYIPRSVVGELQFLADNGDSEKRTRARHGLDIINQLQSITATDTKIFADSVRAEEGVDNRLITLAKKYRGSICTIDYNLNKVAVVEGLAVLNVNELAKTLRMAYLPGERLVIALSQKGNDSHQAVGHLDDGTMVVVEHANRLIGKTAEVEFIRSLQTAAGKMMFAKLVNRTDNNAEPRKAEKALVPKVSKKDAPKPNAGRQPRAPQAPRAPKPPRTQDESKPSVEQKPKQQRTQQRRRRSPEDSLVELANQ